MKNVSLLLLFCRTTWLVISTTFVFWLCLWPSPSTSSCSSTRCHANYFSINLNCAYKYEVDILNDRFGHFVVANTFEYCHSKGDWRFWWRGRGGGILGWRRGGGGWWRWWRNGILHSSGEHWLHGSHIDFLGYNTHDHLLALCLWILLP